MGRARAYLERSLKDFPVCDDSDAAAIENLRMAATHAQAEKLAGAKVRFVVHPASARFATPAEAEAAFPNVYGDPRFELIGQLDGYRVMVRFWQPIPPAPVARGVRLAGKAPLGVVLTAAEAEALLDRTAELIEAPYGSYATEARALQAKAKLCTPLAARIEQSGERWQLLLTYWRPDPHAFGERDREVLAKRAQMPLRSRAPQASPYIGLFERLASENPAIILAEEGDGRAEGT